MGARAAEVHGVFRVHQFPIYNERLEAAVIALLQRRCLCLVASMLCVIFEW